MALVPGSTPIVDPNAPPPPAPFDPKAFKEEILGEFNKTLNGFAASMKKDIGKYFEKPPAPDPAVDPPAGDPPPGDPPATPKNLAEMNLKFEQAEKSRKLLEAKFAESEKEKQIEKEGRLEAERTSAFDRALTDIPFANPKARAQFRAAYLGQVKRDDEGNFVVDTDKGPIAVDLYLKNEAMESPHFLAPEGTGGGGAGPGVRPRKEARPDIANMSPSDYYKLTEEQKHQMMQDNVRAVFGQ